MNFFFENLLKYFILIDIIYYITKEDRSLLDIAPRIKFEANEYNSLKEAVEDLQKNNMISDYPKYPQEENIVKEHNEKLRYDNTPTEYLHTSFRTSTVENVYHLKSITKRPKDITDMKKLEPFVNKEKLDAIINKPQVQAKAPIEPKTEIVNGIKRI